MVFSSFIPLRTPSPFIPGVTREPRNEGWEGECRASEVLVSGEKRDEESVRDGVGHSSLLFCYFIHLSFINRMPHSGSLVPSLIIHSLTFTSVHSVPEHEWNECEGTVCEGSGRRVCVRSMNEINY